MSVCPNIQTLGTAASIRSSTTCATSCQNVVESQHLPNISMAFTLQWWAWVVMDMYVTHHKGWQYHVNRGVTIQYKKQYIASELVQLIKWNINGMKKCYGGCHLLTHVNTGNRKLRSPLSYLFLIPVQVLLKRFGVWSSQSERTVYDIKLSVPQACES